MFHRCLHEEQTYVANYGSALGLSDFSRAAILQSIFKVHLNCCLELSQFQVVNILQQ
jgi:hypothetical protein